MFLLLLLNITKAAMQEICYCCHFDSSTCPAIYFSFIIYTLIIYYLLISFKLLIMMYYGGNQVNNFPNGCYYMIICKGSQKALRVDKYDVKNAEGSKIVGASINPQDNTQLFMVERLGGYDDQFEIVSCPTDYVLQENDKEVVLGDGKQNKHQRFKIVKIQGNKYNTHNYYTFRSCYRPELALSLEGTLRLSTYDPNSIAQHFRLQLTNNLTIQNTCVIVNSCGGRAIDVPASSQKNGQRINIWDRNNRWNQRWFFQKVGQKDVLIKSVINELCLDIAGQSRSSGAKIVQWPQTGGTNQMWYLEPRQNNLYKIWSSHQPNLCLGVRKQENCNGAYLEVTDQENPTTYWRIQGFIPK